MDGFLDTVQKDDSAHHPRLYNQTIMESPTTSTNLWTRTRNDLQGYFDNLKPVWPFFGLLTVAMIILYGLTLSADPLMRQPLNLLVFTLLMLLHTGLHWISPSVGLNRMRSLVYMLLQVALVVVLILFTHSQTLVLGLFMGLSGETLGVIRPLRRSLVAILFLVMVAFALQGIVFGWAGIWPFMVTVVPMTFFVVIYVYLFTRQLEEKTRAEALLKELETAHRQLREYANRIEELTLTTERQRMARELHDTLAQGLAGVILQLEAAGEHLGQGHNEKAAAIVKQASSRARDTLAEARQVIDDLRSLPPTSANLQDFIRAEADHLTALTGLPCEVSIELNTAVPDQLVLHIEKIISEGLTNIVRHAHAAHSWVKLSSQTETLLLEIGDDGQGFAPENYVNTSRHYGLVGIHERVRLAGGALTVISAPGEGTRLHITFPLLASGELPV